MNKKEKGNGLFEKAVVLSIVAVFIGSAFVPAVGSQIGSILATQSSENEDVKIGNEEIVQLTKNKLNNLEDGSSLWDKLVTLFNRFLDILGDNPILKGLRKLFTGRDANSNVNSMDHDMDYINDNLLVDDNKVNDNGSNSIDDNQLTNENYIEKVVEHHPMLLSRDVSWWNTNWSYRKEITIDCNKVDEDLVNFPMLINFTDTDLANHALDNGSDVVFTDANRNQLNHEIELFNGVNGNLIAWVNVTSLSSSVDTILYMYYGNPGCSSQQNVAGV